MKKSVLGPKGRSLSRINKGELTRDIRWFNQPDLQTSPWTAKIAGIPSGLIG